MPAPAADVAEIVGQVSKESYTNYLRNDLYTHDGDDRGSGPEHDLARERIRELFESFGLETSPYPSEYQQTTCNNVVGVHRGISCPNEIYVLGAHYDSLSGSPGAWDNGSGVAGILESARVLSQHAFEGTIVFIAFDREERGLRGSRAYANDHIEDHIHGMLNLDCIAWQDCGPEHPEYNKISLSTYMSRPTRLVDELLDDLTTAVESYTELTCVVRPHGWWGGSDHLSFAEVGFAAVGFEPYVGRNNPFYHTPLDSVDQPNHIDYDLGTRVTQAAVACLATLAMLAPARIYPDFDGDGDVDIEDCVLLIEHWGGSDAQFDIAPPPNGDGVVNDPDLSALLHYWFTDRSSWWDFPPLAQYSGGTGEPNDPYQIGAEEDLMLLGESPRDYNKHFTLTADIDLDPNLPGRRVFDRAVIAPETIDVPGLHGWRVFNGIPFTGVFDGNNHTISHLTIRGRDREGLFGQTGSGARISNLALEGVDVTGGGYVGSLVGFNYGGSITSSYSTGSVSGEYSVGGLVGENGALEGTGNVSNCYSTSSVEGHTSVGGLVGSNARFQTVGGSITTSYSTGAVTGNDHVGGLVGSNYDSSITMSLWDMEASGQATGTGGVGLTTAEMMDPYMLGLNGFANDPNWVLDAGRDYPRLAWEGTAGQIIPEPVIEWLDGEGTEEEPYRIDTTEQLILLSKASVLWDKHFILGADIDLDPNLPGREVFSQAVLQVFSGIFDGDNHTISHLTIRGVSCLGLFGQLSSGAKISSLGLEAVDVNGTGDYVGSLVGHNSHGSSITASYSTGSVGGSSAVGGLVGKNEGSITTSYGTGTASGDHDVGGFVGKNVGSIRSSCSTGSVDGTGAFTLVGGLVGWNSGSVAMSYSTGSASGNKYVGGLVGFNYGGSITSSYSTGTVVGDRYVGGLVGENGRDSRITSSFWDIETSGQATSEGGTGATTAEMQTASTFLDAGWDFMDETENGTEDIWWMPEQDYPRLWWELIPEK